MVEELDSLDDKYIIKKVISEDGAFSIVYLVEDKVKHNKFAAKVTKEEKYENQITNEAQLLLHLSNKSPYIINLNDHGEGELIFNDEVLNKKYNILEYCSKGMLLNYIILIEEGFQEILSKVIFEKILKGVQVIHDAEIAHLDLKHENIFLDETYNLKIADFGVSVKQSEKYDIEKLKFVTGSEKYNSPQVNFKIVYNGYKNDIYSLGIILFSIITGKFPFQNKFKYAEHMRNIDAFLSKYENTNNCTFSPEFKQLFAKMISPNEEIRPSIKKILEDKWFDEIRNMNEEQLNKLNQKLIDEYKERKKKIYGELGQNIEAKKENNKKEDDSRGISEDDNIFFTPNDLAIQLKNEQILENFIRIKGKITPYNFMNYLANILNEKYSVEKGENGLEFEVIKEEEEDEEECQVEIKGEKIENEELEGNEDNQDICSKTLIISITLYEKDKEEYLLNFFKLSGFWADYYDIFKPIVSIVKKIL